MKLDKITHREYVVLIDRSIHPRIPWLGEIEWHASRDGKRVGVVIFDNADNDYSWVLIDRRGRRDWEAIDLGVSSATPEEARQKLYEASQ